MAKRYFEYIDDKSSKFWELSVTGKKITVRYGKIGTDGQTTLKEMNAPAEAKAQAEKLALEKIKKGYVEGGYESIKNKNLDGKSIKGGKKISEKSNLKLMPPNISSTNKGELTASYSLELRHSRYSQESIKSEADLLACLIEFLNINYYPESYPVFDLSILSENLQKFKIKEKHQGDLIESPSKKFPFQLTQSHYLKKPSYIFYYSDAKLPLDIDFKLFGEKTKILQSIKQNDLDCNFELQGEGATEVQNFTFRFLGNDGGIHTISCDDVLPIELEYSYAEINDELADLTNDESEDLDKLKTFVDDCFKEMQGKVDGVKKKSLPSKKEINFNIAENASTPIDILVKLSTNKDYEVRYMVAKNPSTPEEILSKLARDNNENVISAVAQNLSINEKLANILLEVNDLGALISLAENPRIPIKVLEHLLKKSCSYFDHKISKNPCTPLKVLSKLANSEGGAFSSNVAMNSAATADLLLKLATDKDESVRGNVAANSNTPVKALDVLAKDPDGHVQELAATNPNIPVKYLEKFASQTGKDPRLKISAALNPAMPKSQLVSLSKDKNESVRESVAANPSTPKETLSELAKDKSESVRIGVAKNELASLELDQLLAKDKKDSVRFELAQKKSLDISVLELLAKDKYEQVRRTVASNPQVTVNILLQLSTDPDKYVKDNVASNPLTPESLLRNFAGSS